MLNLISKFNAFKDVIKQKLSSHENTLDSIGGTPGYLFYNSGNPNQPISAHPLLSYNPVIVDNEAEAQVQLGAEESFETVFNSWRRISHLGRTPYPSNPSELDAWAFDAANNQIRCTVNSASLIGFISPDRHDDFIFENVLRSTSADDDSVGICLAFTVVNGIEHTLVAMRTPGGSQTHPAAAVDGGSHRAKLLDVYYDIFHPDRRIDLGSTNGGLIWGDGAVNDERMANDIGGGGWSNWPGGTRLRVTRTGDNFKIETSNLGSTAFVPTATVEFTLNDYPELAKFKGPQRYGYVCYSQTNSTWETLLKPAVQSEIVVLDETTSYQWVGDDWESGVSTQQLIDDMMSGRFYFNQSTRKLYYKYPDGTVRRVRGL